MASVVRSGPTCCGLRNRKYLTQRKSTKASAVAVGGRENAGLERSCRRYFPENHTHSSFPRQFAAPSSSVRRPVTRRYPCNRRGRFHKCQGPQDQASRACKGVFSPSGFCRLRNDWNRRESARIAVVCPIRVFALPAARSPAMACELTRIFERQRRPALAWRRQRRPASPLERRGRAFLHRRPSHQLFGGG